MFFWEKSREDKKPLTQEYKYILMVATNYEIFMTAILLCLSQIILQVIT